LIGNHGERVVYKKENAQKIAEVNVVFPVLHGIHGEDGSVQGLMKIGGIPCVGCDLLGSAVCMDKDVSKRLMRDAGIKVADFVTIRKGYNDHVSYEEIAAKLGEELYIKPVNLGSSVGVACVGNAKDFETALEKAFTYDTKVLIEEKIVGREIECAILGNESPKASVIGEIAPTSDFYTFESKYIDKDDAKLSIPAKLSESVSDNARNLAIRVFILLECKGFSRVDMFLTEDEDLIVNEVNTIPGFTNISMYPKLWEYSGIPYRDLLDKLIDLAIKYHGKTSRLLT